MKKVLMLLLVLAMVVVSVPNIAEAQTNSKEEADLYISSVRELNEFATKVNNGNDYAGKTIKLTKDIVFDSNTVNNFVPIGDSRDFNGVFDGAGYVISGIDITDPDGTYEYMGLFGKVGTSGIVKNVNLKASSFTSKKGRRIGSIVAYNEGTIDNCQSDITISVDSYYTLYIGGIVGSSRGLITNCISNSTMTVVKGDYYSGITEANIGGIAGYIYSASISNCINTGSIAFTSESYYNWNYIGGVVGKMEEKSTVQNCFNIGQLTGNGSMAGIVSYVEGIVANSYCSEESASQNIYKLSNTGIEKNNKAFPSSDMKLSSFTDILNVNRGSNSSWLPWVNTSESEFPTLIQVNEVTFKTMKNGLINSNSSYAYKGQIVTLTATANKNYQTSKITIKTASGKKVKITKKNGKFQFKMPSEKVIVSATFKKK